MNEPQTKDRKSKGANVRFPPPLVLLIALVSSGLLQRFVHGTIPTGRALGLGLGSGLILIAVGLLAWSSGLFRKTGQDLRPWVTTPELIIEGVYRFTRNPMYLGMALVQTGTGLMLRSPWFLALLPVTMIAIFLIAIRPEERYLQQKFGDAYLDYKRRTRRWL